MDRSEKSVQWSGRLGAFDIGIVEHDTLLGAAELKWCRDPSKIGEALWDVLKLLPYAEDKYEMCPVYLVYAAPAGAWSAPSQPTELFSSGRHNVSALVSRFEKQWRWLLNGNKSARPVELSVEFKTDLVCCVPVLSAEHPPWEIRCMRVRSDSADKIHFVDGWPSQSKPGTERTATVSPG